MTARIDRMDHAIVSCLLEDGRMSCAEIARRVGQVSERAIRYRIGRLLEAGVIQVKAVVDPRALGLPVTADLFVEVEPALVRQVAEHLAAFDFVSYVAFSTGDSDLSIQLYAADNEQLHHYVTELVSQVPGIRRVSTVLVPRVLKDVYTWPIPERLVHDGRRGRRRRPKDAIPERTGG